MRTEPDINTNRHHLQQNIHSMNALFPSQHETRSTHFSSISNTESKDSGRFFQLDSYDDGLTINPDDPYPVDDVIFDDATAAADEARYNLATRVMSNGVEVIIAGDKNAKGQHKTNALRILPSLSNKPMTLAPSTLKDQMILMMPSNAQENYTISINSNNFITKTCLTTYTYRTTYLQDGMTTVESREKVVSNTATEERNYFKISPTGSLGVTLSRTPELAVGVFHTTYTYYNTILDGDLPLVLSSQHILTNTITGPDDYISFLQPSEEATPILETNTYFSSISLTKTLKESNIEKIVSTSNLLTQVVITESLPPRSTAVMTSYIAFDTDESSIQYESVNDITKQAQSNLNHTVATYLVNNQHDQLYLHTKSNSTYDQVLEKSTPITNVVSTDLASKLHGSFKSDIHIYATKTYLTTFTYLTTLINTHVSATPSTQVNFHTRVIENVITESIPSYLIKSDLLAKFEKNLKISKNRESYVTMVTLPGGHSLEITAINILHTSSTEKKIDSTSILKPSVTLPNDVTTVFSALTSYDEPNAATDSDTASSENDEQFIKEQSQTNVQKNNTKTSDISSFASVNQLIETFNFNRLQALGPVFNAMAGLIQNNFGSPALANDLKKNITAVDVESKHSTKNITAYDSAQSHEGPIYIPVQNLHSSNQHGNIADLKVTGHITPQHLHISPPQADWFKNENQNHGKVEYNLRKPAYETPLLNGGIPISPGEVITANSDVIVGKPNGIQPRIPYSESNSDVGNALLPPPLLMSQLSFSPHSHQQLKQTKAIPRPIPLESNYDKETNFDSILKPPPLNPPYLQQKPQFPHNMLNHNYRLNYAGDHMHQAQHQLHSQYQMQHQPQHQPQNLHTTIMHQHIPLQNTYNKEINQKTIPSNKRIVSQKPNYILYRPHDYDSKPQLDKKSETDLNKELYNNEILEIRKIPEVYSTDLPGRDSMAANSSTNFKNGNFKTLINKVVDSNQPMLVDIKPSQITNIVIPRDNPASILIVESAVELHKNGQYYDEPAIYTDVTETGNGWHTPSVRKPILSNQQVNLDTNVLSHNIDINVPPITFNKDTDFPHSTPVRGQIHRKEASNFHMPHITIPLTDNQIQVNLTPQNALTQKIVGTFINNMDNVNGRENDITESLKNVDSMRYSPSPISPNTKITEHRKNYFNKIPTNTIQPGIKQNTYSIPATSEIKRPTNTSLFVSTPQYIQQTPFVNSNFNHKNVSEPYFPETSVSHRPTYYFALRPNSLKKTQNTPTTRPVTVDESKPRPTLNPAPLLHLFYGLKDTTQKEDSKIIPVHDVDYWEKDSIDDEDEDATEYSNKMEDQKVSSSINIVIPLQNKIKKNELAKSEMDQSKAHTITNKSNSKNLNSNATATNSLFGTEPPTNTKQTNKVDYRSPLIGSESFLDSSSVNAVNNMGELGIEIASSYSPSTFIPTGGRPIHIGKPFSKTKTTVTSPQNVTNQQSISINIGEGFKLHNQRDENQTTPLQMPPAAGTSEFENRETAKNTQTENPFHIKYNKNIKKPLKTSLPIIRPQPPPTKIMQSSKNLNKMQFVNQLYTNRSNYRVRESAEIFDSHESMNPHNHNYVNLANNESITIGNSPQQKVALSASVPSMDIKPPPISVIAASENVVGLNPPPPRTTSQPLPRPTISTPVHIPLFVSTAISNKRSNSTNRKPILKHSYTTNRPVKLSTLSTKVGPPSYSRSTLMSKQNTIINSKLRTSPTSKIYATPSSPISRTASTVGYITPVMDKIPSGIMMSSRVSESTIQNNQLTPSKEKSATVKSELVLSVSIPENIDAEKNTLIYDTESHENPILTLNQQIPDEILIEGSEVDQRRKLSITHFENHTIIYQEPPIVTENPSRIPEIPAFRKSTRKRVIIPTKYVTNTQIITITTTRTSVITSHGIPSTQTLTLTKTQTSTLVDTVTETHTLLKPTKINEGLEMSPTKTLQTDHYSISDIQTTEATSQVHEIQTVDLDDIHQDKTHSTSDINDTMNPITTPNTNQDNENNSIFVVMTDKRSNGGVFSIIPSMIGTPQNINDIGNENDNSIGLDYDENITFNLPTRDEEVGINEVNHVLLGGVLIATPPKANDNSPLDEVSTQCRPSCKASRNELCQMIDNRMGCACRPGFARMFPDRPCRPTYTYAMQIPIHRISKQALHFKEQYHIKDSDDFKQLAKITHDAVDRMIMQSDLRDVYHGVHVTSFDTANSENGILGKFLIQLSDNSDEKRLVDVFKKYLRQNNFSLGGTEIFTTKNGVNSLEIIDFNECAHSQFHDCSENSRCFNLQGTYTCSCQEGYVDLSENSIYPGRICSAEIVGCERCHYHGKCVQEDKNTYPICECFHWYTGASCQVNLKILLIALVTVGTILFIMLLICVLLTCTRKKKNHNMQSLMSGIHIVAPRNSRLIKHQTADKRAMIKDSSSETSQNSLPYSVKDSKKQKLFTSKNQPIQQPTHQQQTQYRNINQRGQPSLALISTLSEIDRRHNFTEQNDRSLTVMIPRAKYHHSLSAQGHTDDIGRTTPTNEVQILVAPLETEVKPSAYQCIGEKNQKAVALSMKTSPNSGNHGALHTSSTGALVSAGFEVSATVGNIISEKKTTADITSHDNELFKLANESRVHNNNYLDQYSQYNTYKDEEKFIDSMDVWLDTIQQNELTAEARSFDETTIQAPTKSLRSIYDRQMTQVNTNDEANTMAERDIGSTFLLPHTHLYKPDRDSDISGFDSI